MKEIKSNKMVFSFIQVSLVLLASLFCDVTNGACTYSDLDFDLYDCFDTRSLTTEYALPVMASTGDATSFCTTHLSNINTCAESAIQACSANSNVTKFFGDGSGLSAAYTYLCNQFVSNSNVEPFSCAVAADAFSIKGNLSDFDIAVDALANPTVTEICSFADTMIQAFISELTSVCSGSSLSITIWSSYLALLKSGCNGADTAVASTMLLLSSICVLKFFKF